MAIKTNLSRIFLASIFIGTIVLLSLGTIFSHKRQISRQEKRVLAHFPQLELSLAGISAWTKAIEVYLNDHFWLREDLVRINSYIRVALFQQSPTFVVMVGKNDWYYLILDWALHDYLGFSGKTGRDVMQFWEKVIAFRQKKTEKFGGQYLVAVVPNKECIYPEFLPDALDGKAGITMLQALDGEMRHSLMAEHFLDLTKTLVEKKASGKQVFFKTDSHWNAQGSYAGYIAIMERVQRWYPDVKPLSEDRFLKKTSSKPFSGDLTMLMGLHEIVGETTEEWAIASSTVQESKKIPGMLDDRPQKNMSHTCSIGGAHLRALVISDSFGDLLTPYFAETFAEVIFSREPTFFELEHLIQKFQPAVVIDLRVARNLPRIMSLGGEEEGEFRKTQ